MTNKTLSYWDYFLILCVFAIAGSTSALITRPMIAFMGLERGSLPYIIVYFVVVTLVYPFILLSVAWIFGKYAYFRAKVQSWTQAIAKLFGKNQSAE